MCWRGSRQLPAVRAAAGDRAVLRAMHVYDENRRVRAEVQALRELPCRLTIEYTPCDGALIFRDYSLAVRREIIRTVKDVCRERGHELTVLLDETQE